MIIEMRNKSMLASRSGLKFQRRVRRNPRERTQESDSPSLWSFINFILSFTSSTNLEFKVRLTLLLSSKSTLDSFKTYSSDSTLGIAYLGLLF